MLRGQYIADIDMFDPSMLVFVDEIGFNRRNLIRQFSNGLRGITPVTHPLLACVWSAHFCSWCDDN